MKRKMHRTTIRLSFIIGLILTAGSLAQGQAVKFKDPDNVDPTKEITIVVDLTQTSNEWGIVEVAAGGEDMYIWTWKPFEFPANSPKANGVGPQAWKNSNDILKMTKEAEGIYSFTLVPTEFYEVDARTVYAEDIHFLVKAKDGGGYGDPDIKTEDLKLEFELPKGPSSILSTFPSPFGKDLDSLKLQMDDVFSVLYDNNEDEKESLKGVTTMYIYPELTGDDGKVYTLAPNAKKVADYPELMMVNNGDGTFQYSKLFMSFIDLFSLPDGVKPASLSILCTKPNLKTTDDIVDDTIEVNLIDCD